MAFFKEKQVRGAHSLNETGEREGKERGLVSHVPDSSEESWPSANALSYFQEAHQVGISASRGRLLEVAQQMSLQIKVEPSEGREGGGWTNPNNLFIQSSLAQLQGVCGGEGWGKGGGTHMSLPFL